MFKGNIVTGTVTGTGAAINVPVGFTPSRVEIFNATSFAKVDWQKTQAAGAGIKTVAAGTRTALTTTGITPYAGAVGETPSGFTIGVEALVNVNTQVIHYTAWGEE